MSFERIGWTAAMAAVLVACGGSGPAAGAASSSDEGVGASGASGECRISPGECRRRREALFDTIVREALAKVQLPGMAVAVLKGDQVLWEKAYGWANLEEGRRATIHTPFELSSVSKTVTATALMQLWEQGKFGLDDDVGERLPFPVRNPAFPDVPITYRMLLTHFSSIADNWDAMPAWFEGDYPLPLGEYMAGYFTPGGPFYDATANFQPWAPGANDEYCNVEYALVGYLVEVISGEPFDEYCQEHIFRPLDMRAGWFLRDFRPGPFYPAMGYAFDDATGQYVAYGYDGSADYPDNQLRTDVTSLSRFLLAHLNGGRLPHGNRILRPTTVQLMHTVQFPGSNYEATLGFLPSDYGAGYQLGHSGANYGWTGGLHWRVADRVGVIELANGEAFWTLEQVDAMDGMTAALEEAGGADCGDDR